jgi:hypothetical protein
MTGGSAVAPWRLLVGASYLALPLPAFGADAQDMPPDARSGDIVVYGERPRDVFEGIVAETELNENDIAAYGFDTVGELVDQVSSEADSGPDGPVILINGQPATGLADVSDLPSEAVSKIQVLPRQAGPRVGQSASRRVINVVIKPNLRQVTGNSNARLTTRGDALAVDGEANLLRLDQGNRASLVLRARHAGPLLESQRDIVTDTSGTPFDFVGNVLAPGLAGEIDPLLSALAGSPVTLAGVPAGIVSPTLANFAARANARNFSDFGDFRSLVGEAESYSANGNLTRRLDPSTTLSLTARLERTTGRSLTGAATGLFNVPAGSPFSPFSRAVVTARAFGDPLEQRLRSTSLALNQALTTRVGKFSLALLGNFNHRISRTESDRDYDTASLQSGITAGTTNPFAPIDLALLGPVRSDLSRSRSDNLQTQGVLSGPLFELPAGPAQVSAKLGFRQDRVSSRTVGRTVNLDRLFKRTEKVAQLNLTLPLLGGGYADDLGQLTLDLTGAVRDISDSPTLNDYGAALTWNPIDAVNLRVSRNVEETAPPSSAINDPVVVIDNFRTFDFVRQDTVLVRYVTGGNPDLPLQRRTTTSIGGSVRPFGDYDFTINGEYQRDVGRNAFAALPPADARVQLAFPDRYIRDANGVLVQLDARPITYERDKSELLRWGIDFKRTFGGTVSAAEAEGGDTSSGVTAGRGWRVNFNADHTWFLDNTRLIRAGLPVIDLLRGGALGFSGGQSRHLVRFTTAAYHNGIGYQLNGDYRSRSTIRAGTVAAPDDIEFAARTTVNARLFVNLGPQFPESDLAKGARVSLAISNLFDSKQRVRDSSGATPLRYQPFLLDPLGRAVTLSLRKVF